jgi:signal transduction histidine kinase
MRERAAAVGGTLTVGPTPDGGWSVRVRLPIGEPAAATSGEPAAATSGEARTDR